MPEISTSRCSNVEELTNRLETFALSVEKKNDTLISMFINTLIANFNYYLLFRPTQSEQVYTLLSNNQELLNNALHKQVDQEDRVFGALERLRDTLSNESCETGQVSKIARGIFSSLQKSNAILPNDRQSVLNYEVQLCQILHADVTDQKLMSRISKFATDLKSSVFQPDFYFDYLKALPLNERIRCLELFCMGYIVPHDMDFYMQCKPEVLTKAKVCCDVIKRKTVNKHFVDSFIAIPEENQDTAIHFMGRLRHHLRRSEYERPVLLLEALAKVFGEKSVLEIDAVVDLGYQLTPIDDIGGFIKGMLAINAEDRADVMWLIQDRISFGKVEETIIALGQIKNKDERKRIWERVKILTPSERVENIKYWQVVDSLPEEQEREIHTLHEYGIAWMGPHHIGLVPFAQTIIKFPPEERGPVCSLIRRYCPVNYKDSQLLWDHISKFKKKEREKVLRIASLADSFVVLEMLSKISFEERKGLLAKANDLSTLVDELNNIPDPYNTREPPKSAFTKSLGLSFIDGVFNLELLHSLMKLSQDKNIFRGTIDILHHIAPDKRHDFLKKYGELLNNYVLDPERRIPMVEELLSLLQLNNENQEIVTRICQDPSVSAVFSYLPILSKATSQGRKDLKNALPALLQAIPVLMLDKYQQEYVYIYSLKLALTEGGVFNVQVATRLLSLVWGGFKAFNKIINTLEFIGLDRRIEFINKFQKPLQNGRWTPEQRIEMHGFLLSELQRNITNQEYVKGFCEWIIRERRSLEIDEEALLFQEVVRLISITEGVGAKNPYTIYQGHKKAESEDPLLDLKMPGYSMSFGGVAKSYSFNLSKVRDTAKTASYVAKDISEEFQPRQLKRLFSELRKRIQELPEDAQVKAEREITVLYSETSHDKKTFREMESNLFEKPFMIEMMIERLPDEKVSFYYYKLACIVKSILSENNQVLEGKVFSAQELRLLDTAHAMSKCITGQKDGVDLVYNDFDRNARYLDEKDLSKGTGSQSAFEDIIREEIQKGLSDALKQPAWRKVLGKRVSQESHQTEYMSNRVGKQIGLNWQLTFDEHTNVLDDGLIGASTQTLAEAVYETFPFQLFVTRVKDNINKTMEAFKGTPGEIYKEWEKLIDRVPKFKECFDVKEDDKGEAVIVGINERGVVEVVKSMGYIVPHS